MLDLDNLKFDDFRSERDILCIQPIRTIVRLEEEITIIKKIRKVEETDVSPTCPAPSYQAVKVNGSYNYVDSPTPAGYGY